MSNQLSQMEGVAKLRAALMGFAAGADTSEMPSQLTLIEGADLLADWPPWARPDQADLSHTSWRTWLILGGRGAGKTACGWAIIHRPW